MRPQMPPFGAENKHKPEDSDRSSLCSDAFCFCTWHEGWGSVAFPISAASTSPRSWAATRSWWNWTWATTPWETLELDFFVWGWDIYSAIWRSFGESELFSFSKNELGLQWSMMAFTAQKISRCSSIIQWVTVCCGKSHKLSLRKELNQINHAHF